MVLALTFDKIMSMFVKQLFHGYSARPSSMDAVGKVLSSREGRVTLPLITITQVNYMICYPHPVMPDIT